MNFSNKYLQFVIGYIAFSFLLLCLFWVCFDRLGWFIINRSHFAHNVQIERKQIETEQNYETQIESRMDN